MVIKPPVSRTAYAEGHRVPRDEPWYGQSKPRREQKSTSELVPPSLLAYSEVKPDLAQLAAAYAFGIARDHPFFDGNKRTAYVVCRTFLILNGHDLHATREEKHLTFLKLAQGKLSEGDLSAWIEEHLVAL